jgi:hypothetical protein
MNTEERLDMLSQSKSWNELTDDEKKFALNELGTEEAYNSFRKVNDALADSKKAGLLPDQEILFSLKTKFRSKHEHASLLSRVIGFRVPAYATALLICVAAVCAWYVGIKTADPHLTLAPVIQKDTVYLSAAPDTVYLTKVVYRNVYSNPTKKTILSVASHEKELPASHERGVSMKEKEELDNILVSGSE